MTNEIEKSVHASALDVKDTSNTDEIKLLKLCQDDEFAVDISKKDSSFVTSLKENSVFYSQKVQMIVNEFGLSEVEATKALQTLESSVASNHKMDEIIKGLCSTFKIPLDDAKELFELVQLANLDTNAKKPKKEDMVWEISDYIRETHHVLCIADSREVLLYQDGIYTSAGAITKIENLIAEGAYSKFKTKFLKSDIANTLHRLEYTSSIDRNEMDSDKDCIVVNNGILNVITGELRPHIPDEKFTTKLDMHYDKNADLVKEFKFYLDSTFKGIEWEIDIFQEWFGYCLYNGYPLAKFLFLNGDGGNGKGTGLTILERFLGESNCSSLSLEEIASNDKFTLCTLDKKWVNICGDIGNGTIKATKNLKKLTGRDTITAQWKYGQPFSFKNRAKLVFAGNELPESTDQTMGFLRRLIVLDFPNSFKEGDKNTIVDLEGKCTTPEALTGILTWAIEGLQRLLKNKKFSHSISCNETAKLYAKKTNPVENFIKDRIIGVEGNLVEKDLVYDIYKSYAKEHGLPSKGKTIFSKEIISGCKKVGINISPKQATYGKRPYCYIGIKLVCDDRVEIKDGPFEASKVSSNISIPVNP
ncbi:DNA primase family protein [Methanococcoides alaskense]|uniref:DNA primase/helicase n=1 Tax=Methanococcoides alaskense TaxID=325778 RepID=A0AA90Z7V1_9EURY|nr:phage/plasmid primase, P4 family [Methanococcoides alaskense]MDA0525664.1 phage/plasmid primase, P4 family [Methanococcoides alaskense]MDR6222890.1 putative DNA primase/helicase [Methanococcoides alaskense]